MILPILQKPDPILYSSCEPIDDVDKYRQLAADMRDTMVKAKGVGLAANQVGHLVRLIVVSIAATECPFFALYNPEIIERSQDMSTEKEGCLSVPGPNGEQPWIVFPVKRPNKITVIFRTRSNEVKTMPFSGLTARVIQHEIDHLNGKVLGS